MFFCHFLRLTSHRKTPCLGPPSADLSRHYFRSFCLSLVVSLGGFGAAGASHNNPRTPNVHIGARRFKHHQNSTKDAPERAERKKNVAREGKKSAKFWASHPSGPTLRGPTFYGFGFIFWEASTLRPTLRGPTFYWFGPPPFGAHPLWSQNSTSKKWPKSKLVEFFF